MLLGQFRKLALVVAQMFLQSPTYCISKSRESKWLFYSEGLVFHVAAEWLTLVRLECHAIFLPTALLHSASLALIPQHQERSVSPSDSGLTYSFYTRCIIAQCAP